MIRKRALWASSAPGIIYALVGRSLIPQEAQDILVCLATVKFVGSYRPQYAGYGRYLVERDLHAYVPATPTLPLRPADRIDLRYFIRCLLDIKVKVLGPPIASKLL